MDKIACENKISKKSAFFILRFFFSYKFSSSQIKGTSLKWRKFIENPSKIHEPESFQF